MRFLKLLGCGLAGLLVTACTAPQPPVALSGDFFQNANARVGLALQHPETPTFSTEGDVRLLDMAIIAAATASLNAHTKTLDLSDFRTVEAELTALLQQKGFAVQGVTPVPDRKQLQSFKDPDPKDTAYYAAKNMTPLASELGVDYLMLIDLYRVGFARPYSGFIPLAPPRAVFDIQGQLVDLRTNRLLWYTGIHKANMTDGNWDEPPGFPGLTNSFYTTLEQAKMEIVEALSHPGDASGNGVQTTAKAGN